MGIGQGLGQVRSRDATVGCGGGSSCLSTFRRLTKGNIPHNCPFAKGESTELLILCQTFPLGSLARGAGCCRIHWAFHKLGMAFPFSVGVGALPSALRGGVRRHEGSSERKVRTSCISTQAWSKALNSNENECALLSGEADALQHNTWLTVLLCLCCVHTNTRFLV